MIQFRASGVGKLMAYPEKDTLSDGALTHVYELASQILLNWEPALDTYEIEKGRVVEDQTIALYNQVSGNFYVKNNERKKTDLFTGECDINEEDEDLILDIKSSYSKKTFPLILKEGDKKLYEWQLDTYMLLWDRNYAGLVFGLVDTPSHLIKKQDPEDWHIVGHIPPELRITTIFKERDAKREQQLINKTRVAQDVLLEILDKRGYKGLRAA
ncbi:hypothetical protein HCY65_10785 [Acinetobacter radioresistens]|uniref:YqaJ viral recombinase domain-containing protein n=1 Tax=Acinetobacter radioresistens SK82 TaxID=596318 RepID=A0ABP2GNM6_ACIRA|nr:hypothetical protein [Acinetobacter radioresistens]EET82820.1 hypothetical protein ACIRA0001_1614 [Acinetobacter radioresistens SK82]MCK4111540.1 hypothetical protein [Acinetobacter radioresistens]QMU05623.1 hypothetical protein FOC39_01585 [Acinetobacter radioresistens]